MTSPTKLRVKVRRALGMSMDSPCAGTVERELDPECM